MEHDNDNNFYDKHDADPAGVYLVEVYEDTDSPPLFTAIFSKKLVAMQWIDVAAKDMSSIVIPFRLDNPKWGNEADRDFPDLPSKH